MRIFPQCYGARVALFSLVAAVLMWLPAFREPFATGFGDWQYFHHIWEVGYVALTRYREWPLWDPYHCGGITIFGNPQSQHLSPLYLVALSLGPTLGSKLFVVLHAWGGFAGMFLFAHKRRLSVPAASLCALTWCGSGFFVWHVATGHAAFLPFYFTPWVVLAVDHAVRDIRYASALAALLTLVLLGGGVYPFPYFILLIGFSALSQRLRDRRWIGVLSALLAAGILTALMGAVRLWPIMDELRRHPRTMPSSDGVSPLEVAEMLTARSHPWLWPPHEFVWAEYGSYVGTAVCVLALIGVLSALRRGNRSWIAGAVLFFALMLGDHGNASPWVWLHALPVYDSLRVPSRFTVLFTLYLTLLAGYGLDQLLNRSERIGLGRGPRPQKLLGIGIVALFAINLIVVQYPVIDRWKEPPVRTDSVSPRFYLTKLPYSELSASLPRMNLGSRRCGEAMNYQRSKKLWDGDKPQVRVIRGRGRVSEFHRTTSRLVFEAKLREPSRVVINQNYAPGWRSNVGRIESDAGRLALELNAGTHRVVLVYRPPMLWASISLTLIGIVLALLLARFGSRFTRSGAFN
jgi:hypothetical protein